MRFIGLLVLAVVLLLARDDVLIYGALSCYLSISPGHMSHTTNDGSFCYNCMQNQYLGVFHKSSQEVQDAYQQVAQAQVFYIRYIALAYIYINQKHALCPSSIKYYQEKF